MKRLYFLFFITLLSATVPSQEDSPNFYDFDPVLFNGISYSFRLPFNTKGHPFLYDESFDAGQVVLRGRKFQGVKLNFDAYNQELILEYKNTIGAPGYIMLSKAWLEKFSLNNKEFELIGDSLGQKRFYQVIGRDTLKVLYFWEKKLVISRQPGHTDYDISEASKTMYFLLNDELHRFRNNRDFINYFNPEAKILIKNYLKESRINVKKTNDLLMLNLISQVNQFRN